MTKYLKCHTQIDHAEVEVGKCYGITNSYVDDLGDDCYEIVSDGGEALDYTVEPDSKGLSFATWFTLHECQQ